MEYRNGDHFLAPKFSQTVSSVVQYPGKDALFANDPVPTTLSSASSISFARQGDVYVTREQRAHPELLDESRYLYELFGSPATDPNWMRQVQYNSGDYPDLLRIEGNQYLKPIATTSYDNVLLTTTIFATSTNPAEMGLVSTQTHEYKYYGYTTPSGPQNSSQSLLSFTGRSTDPLSLNHFPPLLSGELFVTSQERVIKRSSLTNELTMVSCPQGTVEDSQRNCRASTTLTTFSVSVGGTIEAFWNHYWDNDNGFRGDNLLFTNTSVDVILDPYAPDRRFFSCKKSLAVGIRYVDYLNYPTSPNRLMYTCQRCQDYSNPVFNFDLYNSLKPSDPSESTYEAFSKAFTCPNTYSTVDYAPIQTVLNMCPPGTSEDPNLNCTVTALGEAMRLPLRSFLQTRLRPDYLNLFPNQGASNPQNSLGSYSYQCQDPGAYIFHDTWSSYNPGPTPTPRVLCVRCPDLKAPMFQTPYDFPTCSSYSAFTYDCPENTTLVDNVCVGACPPGSTQARNPLYCRITDASKVMASRPIPLAVSRAETLKAVQIPSAVPIPPWRAHIEGGGNLFRVGLGDLGNFE
jgi:hypothetical protein